MNVTNTSAVNSNALDVGSFTHSGSGTLTALNESASNYRAITIAGSYIHTGSGDIHVTNKSDAAAGITITGDLIHRGTGIITATATGSSRSAISVFGTLETTAGSGVIIARAGSGGNASNGLEVTNMKLNSELQTFGNGSAAAVRVGPYGTGDLEFGATSVWRPAIDLLKSENDAAGFISARGTATVTVNPGAQLQPMFTGDPSSLGVGQTFRALVLETASAPITGDFVLPASSPTILFAGDRSDSKKYVLTVTRVFTPGQAVAKLYNGINATNLFTALAGIPAGSAGVPGYLQGIYNGIDSLTMEGFAPYVNNAQLGLTPHDATRLPFFLRRQSDAVQTNFDFQLGQFTSLFNRPADTAAAGFASPGALAMAAPGGSGYCPPGSWRMWLTPLYQQSSHYQAGDREFTDAKEKFGGAALGIGKDFGKLVLGGEIHYIRGKYDSSSADVESDAYGLTLGGRLHNLAPGGGWFDPVVDFSAGYVYGDVDQDRRDLLGFVNSSSPNANLFRAGFAVGNRFAFNDRFIVTPMLGLDYAHVRQDGYTESGPGGFGLAVGKANYDSLRPKIGFELEACVTPKLSATGRAYYRYETMDRNVALHTQFIGSPATIFETVGHKYGRSSGNIGVGLKYQATDRLALYAGYDLILEDKYLGNQFNAGLGWSF